MAPLSTYISRFLQMATAYKAKLLCSGLFVSGRDEATLLKEDLAVGSLAPLRLLRSQVDAEQKTVTVSCAGGFQRVALYRPGLGSTLVLGSTVEALRSQSLPFTTWQSTHPRQKQTLPIAKPVPPEIDEARLAQVVAHAFGEDDASRVTNASTGGAARFWNTDAARTRAVVILYKGEIIAERYAAGFSAETPLLGWSMAKSVVNALVGILVQQGKLSLQSQDLLPEWRSPDDPRRKITVEQLLRMSSGLSFSEQYANPLSDVTTMLFQTGDGAKYAGMRSLAAAPGSVFAYAGGSTVLLCRIIRDVLGGSLTDYFSFPQRALFDRIGMASAVMEPDAAGTFTGSSFMYATARDWAKLGLLYLQDGCWLRLRSATEGNRQLTPESNRLQSVCVADREEKLDWERILPEGWVRYSAAPSETADFYGAHFWRGVPNSFTDRARSRDGGWPEGAYLAAGYQGQFVTVVPSCELVVVRLGLSQHKHVWNQTQFISEIVDCVQSRCAD